MTTKTGTVYIDGNQPNPTPLKVRVDDSDLVKQEQPEVALEKLAEASDHVLYEVQGTFPFDFWPDKLRIALNQLEIIYKTDPFTKYVYPMPINKVLTVRVHKGIIFAELQIEVEGHENDPEHIKYLSKSEAEEASQIILGLKIAHAENINLSEIPKEELVERVKQVAASQVTS